LVIAYDIVVRGYRQKMWIMDLVYPITALYWGPVAVYQYFKRGRVRCQPVLARIGGMEHASEHEGGMEPDLGGVGWWPLSKAVTHCGAGCTLGDIGGEWIVWATGFSFLGISLPADYLLDFVLAWSFGIVFQYFTIAPMHGVTGLKGIWLAIRADTLSILAFQAGLFAGMAIYNLAMWSPPLPHDSATYWMMMQLSMILGFFTAMRIPELTDYGLPLGYMGSSWGVGSSWPWPAFRCHWRRRDQRPLRPAGLFAGHDFLGTYRADHPLCHLRGGAHHHHRPSLRGGGRGDPPGAPAGRAGLLPGRPAGHRSHPGGNPHQHPGVRHDRRGPHVGALRACAGAAQVGIEHEAAHPVRAAPQRLRRSLGLAGSPHAGDVALAIVVFIGKALGVGVLFTFIDNSFCKLRLFKITEFMAAAFLLAVLSEVVGPLIRQYGDHPGRVDQLRIGAPAFGFAPATGPAGKALPAVGTPGTPGSRALGLQPLSAGWAGGVCKGGPSAPA
jgi:hypothetical protein